MIELFLVFISSLLASGILFKHQRVLTFLAAAGVAGEGQWLLLTLLTRTVFQHSSANGVFLAGSIILLLVWAVFYKQWKFPYFSSVDSGRRDAVIIVVLLVTLASAWLIMKHNGFVDNAWVTHGFYNGDTATFVSLVERSGQINQLVAENPFAGNGPLEYPTLLHAGVAQVLENLNATSGLLQVLPIMTYVQILLTVPIFFLLLDVIFPEPEEPWRKWFGVPSRFWILAAQAGMVLYIMALSWDNYIYPQGHFFLTGLFLFEACLLLASFPLKAKAQLLPLGASALTAFVLLRSNAVTGTVAVAVFATFCLLRTNDRKRLINERTGFLFLLLATVFVFLTGHAGQPAFGKLHFSYTAALDMLRLSPILAILVVAIFRNLSRQAAVGAISSILMLLALVTFLFSARNIVVENASRFFYLALLVGFPLLLGQLVQLWYWLKQELLYTIHTLAELTTGWAVVIMSVAILAFPALASVASAHDNLMFKDEQKVDTAMRTALWWVQDHTPANAIFLASPNEPFAIPMFTGRSLLRTDYWLSPDDIILNDVQAAFAGNVAAREKVLNQADYLLLTKDERVSWEPLPAQKIFDNNAVVIYKLR